MACPFSNSVISNTNGRINSHTNGCDNEKEEDPLSYNEYLQLNQLLSCTIRLTPVHDEHLFIVIHQVYELWFKQVIFEIDSVRELFSHPYVDERSMLKVNLRLNRVVKIFTVLVDQIKILETMTPLDFASFRDQLGTSSGFQSWQFRLLENKIGVNADHRIRYRKAKYSDILQDEFRNLVEKSEQEASLSELVATWLERTPGLEKSNFCFWTEFIAICHRWFNEEMENAQADEDPARRDVLMESCKRNQENFEQIFIKENYDAMVARGDRQLPWAAFKGALMIYYNRDEILFHEPFQMLSLLMDIDVLMTKWRSAHVLLVQRQIGSKSGTGGSSGYIYLRSTVSDRYRAFLDLFQLSNYLIPSKYIKELQESLSLTKIDDL